MKKVKLIVDSSSAISKAEADKLGIGFIPLGITLDGQPMRSGVDIDAMQVYERMLKKPKVSTSLPLGSDIINAFDEALKDHDMAIVVSMSHKMSGTNNSLRLMAEEDKYKGKIFVYPGLYLSPWSRPIIKQMKEIVESNDNIERIFELLDFQNDKMFGYLSPGDIYWFWNGGRITKSQYVTASLLHILPILQIKDGCINRDFSDKARTFEKGIKKMCDYLAEDTKPLIEQGVKFKYMTLISEDKELSSKTTKFVSEYFNVPESEIIETVLSPDQTAHLGPTSFGVTISVDFKEIK